MFIESTEVIFIADLSTTAVMGCCGCCSLSAQYCDQWYKTLSVQGRRTMILDTVQLDLLPENFS